VSKGSSFFQFAARKVNAVPLVAGLLSTLAFGVGAAQAQTAPTLNLGLVTFLSGPAAGPFGIPARNAA
jgi:branched-chain amino acid transport system substrate-binding protein